jgi:hypothetical protein
MRVVTVLVTVVATKKKKKVLLRGQEAWDRYSLLSDASCRR